MRCSLRMLTVLLASAVLSAAVTPCPPGPEAHLTSATGESTEPSVKAKCPCSCSEGGAARLATTHLDFALERADAEAPGATAWIPLPERHAVLAAAPYAGLEAVPI